jgi:ubiquinone/menaquinone biosynthesis C-methylase UbiE
MMVKPRVVETDHGIKGEEALRAYDISMRRLRDKGLLQTEPILNSRVDLGCALEIGPGPGYQGLEWLMKTEDTTLKGLDISEDMVALATKNARDYGLESRAEYYVGDASEIPFGDGYFDAIISTNSLHEWSHPREVFNEIYRALRPGGKYFISDLRRDISPLMKWFVLLQPGSVRSAKMRSGFISSVNASYTLAEIQDMLAETRFQGWRAEQNLLYVIISGKKAYSSQ